MVGSGKEDSAGKQGTENRTKSSFGMRKMVSSVIDPLFWCIKGDSRRHVRLRVM